ncbi:MAG: hypothetical protein ACI97K_001474 [Glaciecola sp.]|jgi:hypothetical protein
MRAMLALQQTTPYKRHYPEFKEILSEQGKHLPTFVEREFDYFFRCVSYAMAKVLHGLLS